MTSEEKDFLLRIAPTYITATVFTVYSVIQIRAINRQRKQADVEHVEKMAGMKVANNERIEKFLAWRAAQPTVQEIIEKAEQEVGSIEDVRRKMNDPNHVWEL